MVSLIFFKNGFSVLLTTIVCLFFLRGGGAAINKVII